MFEKNMKKLLSLFLIAIIMISFVGCKKDVIVVTEEEIKNAKTYNEIHNRSYKDYFSFAWGDVAKGEEEFQKISLPVKTEEAQTYLEQMKTIINVCKRKNILVNRETINDYVDKTIDQLKADEYPKNYYQSLLKVLKEKNISFEEYVHLLKEQYYYIYNKTVLKNNFKENGYKENSNKSLDEQFEDYIKKLD